jgi:hypothetical protein
MSQTTFPPGWDEKKVREVIEYYGSQAEDAAAAEIEAVTEGYTLVEVPVKLLPLIRSLVARYEQGIPLDALQEALQLKPALHETNNSA